MNFEQNKLHKKRICSNLTAEEIRYLTANSYQLNSKDWSVTFNVHVPSMRAFIKRNNIKVKGDANLF
jgi:hypothetical protein